MILDDIESRLDAGKVEKHEVKSLQKQCHPDLFDDADKAKATEIFKRLSALYSDESLNMVLLSPTRAYVLKEIEYVGDVADIYRAACDGSQYQVKISRHRGGDKILDAERECLSYLLKRADGHTYEKYLPLMAESFHVRGKNGISKTVNVFAYPATRNISLAQILKDRGQIDGRHVAWIFKRLLAILGFCGDYVHGAVTPHHIIVYPENHGVRLVGWGHSVKKGKVLRCVPAEYKSWYPSDVVVSKRGSPSLDIYMAATCMLHAGKDLPKQIDSFLRGCLVGGDSMRPSDAWDLSEEFDGILRTVYGKPRFVVFDI